LWSRLSWVRVPSATFSNRDRIKAGFNANGIDATADKTRFVVQNQHDDVAKMKIALGRGLRSGRVLRRLGDPFLDVPTTIDEHRNRLYAVNARFGTSPASDTRY
jgi:hypothetical protein